MQELCARSADFAEGAQGVPGEAPARVQRPLTRAADLAEARAAQDDLVAVLEEGPRRAVGELDRLRAVPGQLEKRAALRRCSGPEIVPEASRSPVRSEAPLTVRWAICWATLQYRWRALVRETTCAVELDLEREVERPRLLAQVGQRRGLLRRRGATRRQRRRAAAPSGRSRSRTTCRGTGRAARYSHAWMSRALQSLTQHDAEDVVERALDRHRARRAGSAARSRSRARARCRAGGWGRSAARRRRAAWPGRSGGGSACRSGPPCRRGRGSRPGRWRQFGSSGSTSGRNRRPRLVACSSDE